MQAATEMVSRFFRQPVFTVGPGATVEDVLALTASKGIHHVPIVQSGRILGLVCTCDLNNARPDLRALQLARRNVVTATPDCSAAEVARMMLTNAVGSVVLANRDGIWGIVTRRDLAQARPDLAELLDERKCTACGARSHLRPGVGDTMLCVACAERARASHWFEEGGSD